MAQDGSGAGVVRQPAYSGDTLAANSSVVVQLPLDVSLFNNSELWFQNVGQDVHIELHPRNGVTTAASSTDVTVTAMQFNIHSEVLEEGDSQVQSNFFSTIYLVMYC